MSKDNSAFKPPANKPFHIEGDIWFVPCLANHTMNTYTPLVKPRESEVKSLEQKKKTWTEKEDNTLKKIVLTRGINCWSKIAKELNIFIHGGFSVRQGRQCRERWYNYVDPELNKGSWSLEEDKKLLELQSELGNKWSEISRIMKGRNENAVKNRWKSITKNGTHNMEDDYNEDMGFGNETNEDGDVRNIRNSLSDSARCETDDDFFSQLDPL